MLPASAGQLSSRPLGSSDARIVRPFYWSGHRKAHYGLSTNSRRILAQLGIALLQLLMTQVVTFLVSLLVPDIEGFQQDRPALFVLMLGGTFTLGVFLVGWLALSRGWLKEKPRYLARLLAALLGAYLPLVVGLILYRTLEAGNPFFFISTLASVVGFRVPGWARKE